MSKRHRGLEFELAWPIDLARDRHDVPPNLADVEHLHDVAVEQGHAGERVEVAAHFHVAATAPPAAGSSPPAKRSRSAKPSPARSSNTRGRRTAPCTVIVRVLSGTKTT